MKITLFNNCQDPLTEEVDLLLSHAKGFMFWEKLMDSQVKQKATHDA